MKVIEKTISIPIYDCELRIVIAKNDEGFERSVWDANYKGDLTGCKAITLSYPDNPKLYYIIFHVDGLSGGCIAHESFRVTEKIADCIGLDFAPPRSESVAYLLEFIVDCVNKIAKIK